MSTTYAVKKGDTFKSLAKKYHGNYTEKKYYDKLIKTNGKTMPKNGTIELPWSTTVAKMTPAKPKPKVQSTSKKVLKKSTKRKAKKTVPKKVQSNCKKCVVDKHGFICKVGDKQVIKKQYTRSEHGSFKKVEALILHRTDDSKISWDLLNQVDDRGRDAGVAAHFYVETDGKIYQVASLKKRTWHIGRQRRCRATENTALKLNKKFYLDIDTAITDPALKSFMKGRYTTNKKNNTATSKDKKMVKVCKDKYKGKKKRFKKIYWCINEEENSKIYPNRYPSNSNAIGIEVVGRCTNKTKGIWEAVTTDQAKSVAILYDCLTKKYNLTKDDIYTHEQIAHKTLHEGTYVWNAIKTLIRKDHQ